MINKSVVPPHGSPNHEGRVLFFSLLNQEWPELKIDLIDKVWPAYRQCWREWPDTSRRPPRGFVGRHSPDGAWMAPAALLDWNILVRSRVGAELRRAMNDWASGSGRGLVDAWLLDSALVSLHFYSPALEKPCATKAPWQYSYKFRHSNRWGRMFQAQLTEPQWRPGDDWYFGSWDQFERRMVNEFRRSLSAYRKAVMAEWGISKENAEMYARWTIARLSGLSWPEIVKRYSLRRYSEGETQAKKRVKEFSAEIGLHSASRQKQLNPSRNPPPFVTGKPWRDFQL